jgi:hypothetical protein
MQAWIIFLFSSLSEQVETDGYTEAQHATNKYHPRRGKTNVEAYKSMLDRILAFDIYWIS